MAGASVRPLSFTVRLQVNHQRLHVEPPNRRISWSITLLAMFPSFLVFGLLAPRLLLITSGLGIFLIAFIFGTIGGLVVNSLRPPYQSCSHRWRRFYDFLLRQLPPPD
jgi:hypothetical protein